jgi:hypothetical protein
MTNITYHCKFCGTDGMTSYDETIVTPDKLNKWIPYIACARCCKFYESKRSIQDSIRDCCMVLIQTRNEKQENKEKIFAAMRTKLLNRTTKFAEQVCDYLRIENVNDESFVTMLTEKPDHVNLICGKYFSGLRRQFQTRPTHNDP